MRISVNDSANQEQLRYRLTFTHPNQLMLSTSIRSSYDQSKEMKKCTLIRFIHHRRVCPRRQDNSSPLFCKGKTFWQFLAQQQ